MSPVSPTGSSAFLATAGVGNKLATTVQNLYDKIAALADLKKSEALTDKDYSAYIALKCTTLGEKVLAKYKADTKLTAADAEKKAFVELKKMPDKSSLTAAQQVKALSTLGIAADSELGKSLFATNHAKYTNEADVAAAGIVLNNYVKQSSDKAKFNAAIAANAAKPAVAPASLGTPSKPAPKAGAPLKRGDSPVYEPNKPAAKPSNMIIPKTPAKVASKPSSKPVVQTSASTQPVSKKPAEAKKPEVKNGKQPVINATAEGLRNRNVDKPDKMQVLLNHHEKKADVKSANGKGDGVNTRGREAKPSTN